MRICLSLKQILLINPQTIQILPTPSPMAALLKSCLIWQVEFELDATIIFKGRIFKGCYGGEMEYAGTVIHNKQSLIK